MFISNVLCEKHPIQPMSQCSGASGILALQVVDTTGAGDCFTGAYAVAVLEGKTAEEALRFAGRVTFDHTSGCPWSMPLTLLENVLRNTRAMLLQ